MKTSRSRRISFYIRVSTEEQASNPEGSIKNQEERLRMAVKLKNMEGHFGDIVSVYIDRAKSGKDTNRPELQKLLMAIRKRETNLVMVSELSRISRSIKDFSEIWQLMKIMTVGFSHSEKILIRLPPQGKWFYLRSQISHNLKDAKFQKGSLQILM